MVIIITSYQKHKAQFFLLLFSVIAEDIVETPTTSHQSSAEDIVETPTTSMHQSSAVSSSDVPAKVFLSYSHKQKEEAVNVFNYLVRNHIPTWIDKEKMRGGDRMYKEMDAGISKTKVRKQCFGLQSTL